MTAPEFASAAANTAASTVYRTCPFCEACCGLELKMNGHQIISVRGNANDVFSHGYICPKGTAIKDLHEDPDRLRQPLVKRDGKFVAVSWDEAFAEIEQRLLPLRQQYGNDAVAAVVGNPGAHKAGLLLYYAKLARALGTRNLFSASTLDQMPKQLASGWMYGTFYSIAVPDIERTDLLVILGANPMASNGSLWTVPDFRGKAKALRARGGRMVVIDPRRTETAHLADKHYFIRPGSDVFLLLGMVHTLFAENLCQPGRLREWLNGWDELQQAVHAFAPEAMAARCGIDADNIKQLARQLASSPRSALYARIGSCTQEFGTLASWLVDVVNILTGNLDREGGMLFPRAAGFATNTMGPAGKGRGIVVGRRHARVSQAPEVLGELPISCLAEEIETQGPGQVRALITLASNPVLSAPNGPRLSKALEQLDFMLSFDIYLNETTRHADVILPGPSPLEDAHFDVAFQQFAYRNFTRFSAPILPMPEGQPPEWQLLARLTGMVQGAPDSNPFVLDDGWFADDINRLAGPYAEAIIAASKGLSGPERQIDFALRLGPYGDRYGQTPEGLNLEKVKAAQNGIDLGPLQARVPELLRTPSGKIELAEPALLQDLARVYAALQQAPADLVLIGRRDVRSGNSWMHNLPVLAKGPYRCEALVHPQDAARHGVADGAQAQLSSAHGRIAVQVKFCDDMMPGVISLPHGWGHDLPGIQMQVAGQRPGVNMNELLDENWRDPLSGNSVLSGIAVQLAALALTDRQHSPTPSRKTSR